MRQTVRGRREPAWVPFYASSSRSIARISANARVHSETRTTVRVQCSIHSSRSKHQDPEPEGASEQWVIQSR